MVPSINTAISDRNQALVTALSYFLPLEQLTTQSEVPEKLPLPLSPQNSTLFSPQVPALAAAVDTLSLTIAAIRLQDDSLARLAIKRYTISIALLRDSVADVGEHDRNEVLLAILILQIAEVSPILGARGQSSDTD